MAGVADSTPVHADELAIDEPLVRRMLDEQLPHWSELAIERVRPEGMVNAIFRLGDRLAVRLPRRVKWSYDNDPLDAWLPQLAPELPLEVPVPIARGVPTDGYPAHWSVVTWVDGEAGVDAPFDPVTRLAISPG